MVLQFLFPGLLRGLFQQARPWRLQSIAARAWPRPSFRRRLAPKALELPILDLVVPAGLGGDDVVDVGAGGVIETVEGAAVEDVIVENGLNVEEAATGGVV